MSWGSRHEEALQSLENPRQKNKDGDQHHGIGHGRFRLSPPHVFDGPLRRKSASATPTNPVCLHVHLPLVIGPAFRAPHPLPRARRGARHVQGGDFLARNRWISYSVRTDQVVTEERCVVRQTGGGCGSGAAQFLSQ